MNVKRIISWFLCVMLFAQFLPLTYAEESTFFEEPNEESIISETLMGEISAPQAMESLGEESIKESSEGLAEKEIETISSDLLAWENLGEDNQPELQSSKEEALQETEEDHNKTITPVCVKFICDPEETIVTVYDPAHLDENGEPTVIEPEEDGSWLLLPGTYFYDAECEGYETVEKKYLSIVEEENLLKQEIRVILSREAYSKEFSSAVSGHADKMVTAAAVAGVVGDDYPANLKNAAKDSLVDPWNFYNRECTSFVAWCLNSRNGVNFTNQYKGASRWGNAKTWGTVASGLGITVNNTPAVGSVAWWNTGDYGHVAWVAVVNGDQVTIEEYNHSWDGKYNSRTISGSNPTGYIHINDLQGSYALDLNGFLDGVETTDLGDFCTVDVYINGKLELSGVNDYYKVLPAGTTYEFKNLKVKYGRAYDGVDSGSMGGTLSGYQNVRMVFRTIPDQTYGESFKAGTFNGHTYRYYSTPVTWYEANYYSQKLGGHLVTITSEAENSFVLSLCENSQIHIGMSRGEDGVLRWVTGESMNYTNWKSGEPSNWWGNDERSENYGKFSVDLDGTWNDGAGYFKEGFVCEFDEAPVYTVTLDPNGGYFDKTGSTTPKQISKKPGEELDFTGTEYSVSRQGYVWLGFSLSKTEHIYPENSEFGLWYSEDESVTLYAAWDPVVSYDANGGTGAPARQVKELGSALTLSSTTPTRASSSAGSFTVTLNANGGSISQTSLSAARTTSYTFKNWNTAANGSGTTYNAGASYTVDEPATLYAQWNSSTTTAAVNLPSPTRSGYTFQGWATNSGATSGVTGSYTPDGNVTLYAIWKQKNTNGGEIQISGASAAPGNEVILNVNLAKNPGIMLLSFKLSYDESKLQFLGGEDAGLTGWTFSTAGKGVLWDGDKNSTTTGTVAKLRFQVLDSAEDGTTEVNLIEVFAANYDEQEVAIEANSGTVTISRRLPGDATDDGKVNGFDLIRMRKYLAGEPVEINLSNADVTGDGKFNGFDLIRFRKFLAGEAVELK